MDTDSQPQKNDVVAFFQKYEKNNNSTEVSFLMEVYAQTFFFCGPDSQQSVNRDDFLKVIPKMKGFYQSLGHKSTQMGAIQTEKLDETHWKALVEWTMHFEQPGKQEVSVAAPATYILNTIPELKIIVQLDHQDLMKKVKELGLN